MCLFQFIEVYVCSVCRTIAINSDEAEKQKGENKKEAKRYKLPVGTADR